LAKPVQRDRDGGLVSSARASIGLLPVGSYRVSQEKRCSGDTFQADFVTALPNRQGPPRQLSSVALPSLISADNTDRPPSPRAGSRRRRRISHVLASPACRPMVSGLGGFGTFKSARTDLLVADLLWRRSCFGFPSRPLAHIFMCWPAVGARHAPPAAAPGPSASMSTYPTYSEPVEPGTQDRVLSGNGDGLSTSHLDSRRWGRRGGDESLCAELSSDASILAT